MRNKFFIVVIGVCAILMLTFAFSAPSFAKKRVIFGGGPAGGTFQVVANGIQVYKPIKAEEIVRTIDRTVTKVRKSIKDGNAQKEKS